MQRQTNDKQEDSALKRLKTAYAQRQAQPRPMSHSVAVAYRKVIASKERTLNPEQSLN